jgi:hypothetical protein
MEHSGTELTTHDGSQFPVPKLRLRRSKNPIIYFVTSDRVVAGLFQPLIKVSDVPYSILRT